MEDKPWKWLEESRKRLANGELLSDVLILQLS
jgi:hypothetical protein